MSDLDLPLNGPALYNPHLLSKEELLGLFSARQALLDELLADLRSTPDGESAQHHLVVGQRGMGKTMLLRRLQFAVEDDPDLRETWLALSFPEEQYNVAGLSDFWLNCLDALSDTLDRLGHGGSTERLDRAVDAFNHLPEDERARRALDELIGTAQKLHRRFLLLVDNADLVLDRIGDQEWSLREALSSQPAVTFLGASAATIESTYQYDKAFYDFFRIHNLSGLSIDETRNLLRQYATLEGREDVAKLIEHETGRVRTLHTLTGGNPRTLALLFNIFTQGPDGNVRTDLERLLDQCTPLYKARFEALPAQAQQIVDALALRWDPTPAGELAKGLRLKVNAVSAQLNRLTQMGIVEKVPYEPATKTGFQIAERFFNIWYLMRASRRVRRRLVWLVEFLRMFYDQEELRQQARHLFEIASSLAPRDRLQDAEFLFALAAASDDESSRRTLEHSALQMLASQKDLRRHLSELVDLETKDTEFRTRAEYLERFGALRERVYELCQSSGGLLDRQRAEKLLRAPVPLDWKEDCVRLLLDAPTAKVEELARMFANTTERLLGSVEPLHYREALLKALEREHMTALDDLEGARVAEQIDNLHGLVAIAAAARAVTVRALEPSGRSEESMATLESALPEATLLLPWLVWLLLIGKTAARDRLEWAIDQIARLPSEASGILIGFGLTLCTEFERADEAEQAVRRAVEIDASNNAAWESLASILRYRRKERELEQALRKVIELNPASTQHRRELADLLERQGRIDEAEQTLRDMVQVHPSDPLVSIDLAIFLMQQGRHEEAKRTLQGATERDPENNWPRTFLEILLRHQGPPRRNDDTVSEAIEESSESTLSKNSAGRMTLPDRGDIAEAAQPASQADLSERIIPSMAQTLATILARRGSWSIAEEAMRYSLEGRTEPAPAPNWPEILSFFSEAVAAQRIQQAIALLDSMNLGERWRPLREALESLAQDNPDYLRRVAPEVRKPAEAILEELTKKGTARRTARVSSSKGTSDSTE